jgi:hypothetical protein
MPSPVSSAHISLRILRQDQPPDINCKFNETAHPSAIGILSIREVNSKPIRENGFMSFDQKNFVRAAIAAEMAYCRDKQWKIFSWSASLLTAIIGGVVAINLKHCVGATGSYDFTGGLSAFQKAALAMAAFGLWS